MPIARKYAGDTPRPSDVSLSQLRAVSSLYAYGDSDPLPVSGSCDVNPTSVTPGSARSCSSIWRRNAARTSGLGYFVSGIARRNVSTPAGSNPGRTCWSAAKLRIIRPAPMSSTSASAISAIISTLRRRTWSTDGDPVARSVRLRSRLAARRAGTRPKHDRRERAGADGEEQHGAVDAHGVEARQVRRVQPRQRPRAGPREHEPGQAAAGRQHEALGRELPQEPRAAGAERAAHRHLALARGRAREEQVRDVRARDQQHEADRHEQRHERPPRVLDDVVLERHDADLHARRFVHRVLGAQLPRDLRHDPPAPART